MNPILIDIPTKLETERLILRMPEYGDGKAVNKAIHESINELKSWMPFAQELPTVEETEQNNRQAIIRFIERSSLRYLIFHKETNEFIGSSGISNINWDIPKGEIGYWLHTKFGGKGYMKEAIQELTTLALQTLHFKRVEIRCELENVKSRAIPEKLGYKLEGILTNDDMSADGKRITDTCIYAKTN